jgi:thymidylate synthase
VNQLEIIIHDLEGELARKRRGQGPMRHMYEAQIFAPGKDRRPWGFPCMSSLSFHLDGDQLRLSATYRNQYYMQNGFR